MFVADPIDDDFFDVETNDVSLIVIDIFSLLRIQIRIRVSKLNEVKEVSAIRAWTPNDHNHDDAY